MNDETIKSKLANKLESIYPDIDSDYILYSFCPYRVCPVGAHIDHQKGNVTGFAINYGITMAFVPSGNRMFEATSLNFDGLKGENILDISEKKNDWADYLRGAAKILRDKYGIEKGLYCVIDGSLPIGGISSSAAVIIAFAKALCMVNGLQLSSDEIINLVQEVENKYIGVNSGKLDQSCEVLSKKDNLLYLDISTGEYQLIPQNPNMKPYKIAIVFSGIKRTLVGSAYNTRVDELKSAAYSLKAFSGMNYGKYNDTVLRDVPYDVYKEFGSRLPEQFRKRAEHYYSEMDRVKRGVEAWKNGDIEELGRISFESGDSSIENYEAGSPELKKIHEIMKETDGIYGGRFSGAGFKGCCLAFVDPSLESEITQNITQKYLEKFPQYKDSFGIYYCDTADGCDFDLEKPKAKKMIRR